MIKVCELCKKEFYTFNPNSLFCSRECYTKNKKDSIPKMKCEYCGKEFKTCAVDIKRGRKYCSKKCFGLANVKIDKTPKICEQCGCEFIPEKIAANRVHLLKFCSKQCYLDHRKLNPIDRSKQDIMAICKYCGKEFITTKYRLEYGKCYCSNECKDNDLKKEYIDKVCECCGKEFKLYNNGVLQYQKYCSKECAIKSISKEIIIVKCNNCGEDVIIKGKEHHRLKSKNGNFCNTECVHEYLSNNFSGQNAPAWMGGISFEPYCEKFNERRKRSVRDFFNNKCLICGKHQSDERFRLSVHHVNYDKTEGCGGRPFNLVPLCHTCHTRTNHKRDHWEKYIKDLLEGMFDNGVYSREEYETKVMYPE